MKKLLIASLLIASAATQAAECPDVLKHVKRKLNSQETVNMCEEYAGKAVLFVNTASKCGYTPQFDGLETLYSTYKDKGLMVVGFPSNDFNQELADEGDVAEVCQLTYGVNFPMFEPTSVRGKDADPLFAKLAQEAGGKSPTWNFNKYLMNKDGTQITHYPSNVKPLDAEFLKDIADAL